MAKQYMVGTLGDKPLLMVTYNGVKYLVDEKEKKVYLDDIGLPRVKDKETVKAVLELA